VGGSPASPSEVLRTMTGVGGPKHLGGSATDEYAPLDQIDLTSGRDGSSEAVEEASRRRGKS